VWTIDDADKNEEVFTVIDYHWDDQSEVDLVAFPSSLDAKNDLDMGKRKLIDVRLDTVSNTGGVWWCFHNSHEGEHWDMVEGFSFKLFL